MTRILMVMETDDNDNVDDTNETENSVSDNDNDNDNSIDNTPSHKDQDFEFPPDLDVTSHKPDAISGFLDEFDGRSSFVRWIWR